MAYLRTREVSLLTIVGIVFIYGLLALPALGEFVEMDPDNEWFTQNGVVDGHGVTIRSWTANPPSPLSVWNQAYQKLYARDPMNAGQPYLGIRPSTGSLVFGTYGVANLHGTTRLGGNDGYVHILFDNPTNFVGFDLLWPVASWTEGVRFSAWTEDDNGNESVVYNQLYNEGPAESYTRVGLFQAGITRIRLWADQKDGFDQRYFGLDNLTFVNTSSASTFTLEEGETIVAPEGLNLNSGDRLTGTGTVEGSLLVSGGVTSPGSSPGQIVVNGDFSQDDNSVLQMEIADNTHDQLLVSGKATLAGTLELSLLSGFVPEDGQSFTPLTYNEYEGAFDEILGLGFQGGYFEPTYGPDSFTVTAVIPEPTTLVVLTIGSMVLVHRRRK